MVCSDDITGAYRQVMEEVRRKGGGSAIAHPGEFEVEEG